MKATPITVENIDQVVPLFNAYRIFYKQESDLGACRSFLLDLLHNNKNHMWMVSNLDGQSMGFVNLYPSYSSVSMAPVFTLNDLYVSEGFRKLGVGTFLLNWAANWARSNGAIRMHLETGTSNITAQRLYESIGWQKEKGTIFYFLPLT